ncbi:uncharacterized protein Fot_19856 [Forsythia ovata]|uniref:Uncharacterized protein n=1 Tax=Forsythia ovata TaxID=205694 RepID=A0ABD1VM89_9LAMI
MSPPTPTKFGEEKVGSLKTMEGFNVRLEYSNSLPYSWNQIKPNLISFNKCYICFGAEVTDLVGFESEGFGSLVRWTLRHDYGGCRESSKPLAISGQGYKQPFGDETFDFIFFGGGMMEKSMKLGDFVAEIPSTLKPKGCVG